jgi:hypothetical protein
MLVVLLAKHCIFQFLFPSPKNENPVAFTIILLPYDGKEEDS